MNITALLDSLGVEYKVAGQHHHAVAGWLQLPFCPKCSRPGDRNFRLGVNIRSRRWNCWGCGRVRGGEALAAMTGLSVSECIQLLGETKSDWFVPSGENKRGKLVVPDGVGRLLPAHRKYLASRNIDPDYAEKVWGIQGIGRSNRLPWRLWLPIRLERTLSWTTRTIGKSGLRYVSASPDEEEVSHKELLYGEDLAGNNVLVVEGPLDAVRFGPGAVATFGTSFTQAQVQRLARFATRYICYDGEPVAQRKAGELADKVGVFPGQTKVVEIDAKDVGSADEHELELLRKLL